MLFYYFYEESKNKIILVIPDALVLPNIYTFYDPTDL